jgi:membrane-associated phospholipid phosphatase
LSAEASRLAEAGRRCYSRRGFLQLGGALLGAGALIYSGADARADRWHRDRVRSLESDELSRGLKSLGERPWFLAWGLVALLDARGRSTSLTRWGRRNFEAMVVGLPLLWSLQYGLGASRPTDGDGRRGPRWGRPLRDDNSASGHAFMGAVPWLTAARMAEGPWLRAAAYAGSLLTGWSRVNDRKHYLSQVWLGWFAAWSAAAAVATAVAPDMSDASDASDTKRPAPDLPAPADS